jgi:hypothetical protein
MSQTKIRKRVGIDTKDFLAGIQALTVFYEQKANDFLAIKEQFGEEHPATISVLEELTTLSDILNHFSTLVGDQLKGEGENFN